MATIVVAFPQSGLSGTISVVNMTTEVEDFSGAINEIGTTKTYKYEFVEVADTDYSFVVSVAGYDAISGAIFRDIAGGSSGGLTTEEHNKLFSLENSTGGGGFSSQAIQTSIYNAKKEIIDKIETDGWITRTNIEKNNNETNSHIDIAKTYIINTIESIEQAEYIQEEKEAKKAIKLLTTLDKKVSSYIDSEKNDKEELGAIARELNKLDIEDEMKMKEKKQKEEEEKKMEAEEQKKEEKMIAEILNAEFDKLDQQEQEDKKKELEKELEEAKKEVIEIETELKSL